MSKKYLVVMMHTPWPREEDQGFYEQFYEQLHKAMQGTVIATICLGEISARDLKDTMTASVNGQKDIIPVIVYHDDGYETLSSIGEFIGVAELTAMTTGNMSKVVPYAFELLKGNKIIYTFSFYGENQ